MLYLVETPEGALLGAYDRRSEAVYAQRLWGTPTVIREVLRFPV